jgi:antitoxin MazE
MSAKIQKWGNSLGIRIPKAIIEQVALSENSEVEIEHRDGAIIIYPVKNQLNLNDLVAKITKSNLHKEDDDLVLGNEVW